MSAQHHSPFSFDNTYVLLPEKFYSKLKPAVVPQPKVLLFNKALSANLGLDFSDKEGITQVLSGNLLPEGTEPFAQAYAGHQFGHFTMLGDGRAIHLGEQVSPSGAHFDVQLKGSGRTPYSRGGDGKATLKAMLREYFMSEALHHLGIPTSRSLAVVTTGETVYRETPQQGAVLTRIMSSHIRVGTFEFARYYGSKDDLQELTTYTIKRHFPELEESKNPALALLEKVMHVQTKLIVEWMRVGFIHGVMNTDNTSVCGETFDYGPCAFMNAYNPDTVFSSIDTQGRYAFGNQPKILKWNLAKFAEALLPIIHKDEDTAVKLAVDVINTFDRNYYDKWYTMMFAKIGISNAEETDFPLLHELIDSMQQHKADYTNTFLSLSRDEYLTKDKVFNQELDVWKKKWKERLQKNGHDLEEAKALMQQNNPVIIPRNVFVEKALNAAENGDLAQFNTLLKILETPYTYKEEMKGFLFTDPEFDGNYQTFCGT